jgi:hypothetical protein
LSRSNDIITALKRAASEGLRLLKRLAREDGLAMDWLAHHYFERRRFSLAKEWAIRAVERGESGAPARLAEIENAHRLQATRRARKHTR